MTYQKSIEMLEKVNELKKSHPISFKPENSALLIIDMQKYFLSPSSHAYIPDAPAIVSGIKKLVEAYFDKGLPVIFTRHINTEGDSKMLGRWWDDVIKEENPLSEIIEELNTDKGMLIKKTQYDAFYKTDLENILTKKNVTQVVICGVMTHLCCETTARSAFVRGFEVFFSVDGCATYNDEFHLATLLNLSHGFAIPVLIDEILNLMG